MERRDTGSNYGGWCPLNILVNGIGNIGTTLANVLLEYRDLLGIDKIYLNKNIPQSWQDQDLTLLKDRGAEIYTMNGAGDLPSLSGIISDIDYIFETTNDGTAMRNLEMYRNLDGLKGACAQGSEVGFGTPFMSGFDKLNVSGSRFVTIVSCNTQAVTSLLITLAGHRLENLQSADFVMVRRSEDIGNSSRLVGANVIGRHSDEVHGSHPVENVISLFKSAGLDVNLTISAVNTPSQALHASRFSVTLNEETDEVQLVALVDGNDVMSITQKFDSNAVFELGRRYGFQGRIYSHAIVVTNNLLISGNTVRGWMFIPQEGSTILSTIEAYLHQTENSDRDTIYSTLKRELLKPVW